MLGEDAKKIILFLPPSSSSGWANYQINGDRLTKENQILICAQ